MRGATSGYTGENYTNGMRAMFFSDTSTNPWSKHITGIGDMANHIPEEYWHYYVNWPVFYPALGGYTVKYVSDIEIYSSQSSGEDASASLTATANVETVMVDISLDKTEIDYRDVGPGLSSDNEAVEITNIGTSDVEVTLEVNGETTVAQSFYEQSLHVDENLYNPATIIAQIPTANSDDVITQLSVPSNWNEAGTQESTFVFWAEV